jgi:diacylglycerol kinase (ATP)
MEEMLVIANPVAARFSNASIGFIKRFFETHGTRVSIYSTKGPGDATTLARASRGKYDVVVAMGGDGTINEVTNGLAGSTTPMGILPLGTGNALAQGLKIPRNDILAAAKIVLKQRKRRVDLGMVNQRYFILVSGVGFDALVAAKVRPKLKKYLGILAYPLIGIREISRYRPTLLTVTLREKVYSGRFVIIGNSKVYGGILSFATKAEMDDGLLDIIIFGKMGLLPAFRYYLGASVRLVHRFSDVIYLQTDAAEIRSEAPVPVHMDAEAYGTTPVTVRVCERCLDLLVP